MDKRKPRFWLSALAGLSWGLFISVVPFDLLFITALLWFPLFMIGASRPGFLVRVPMTAGVLLLAWAIPVKYEDCRRVELPGATVTLSQLGKDGQLHWRTDDERPITFSSDRPTFREVAREVEAQTPYRVVFSRCGTGMSLLSGGYVMFARLEPK